MSTERVNLGLANELVLVAKERDALRAEVARLKAACENEFASVMFLDRQVETLKAENARLIKLAQREEIAAASGLK